MSLLLAIALLWVYLAIGIVLSHHMIRWVGKSHKKVSVVERVIALLVGFSWPASLLIFGTLGIFIEENK